MKKGRVISSTFPFCSYPYGASFPSSSSTFTSFLLFSCSSPKPSSVCLSLSCVPHSADTNMTSLTSLAFGGFVFKALNFWNFTSGFCTSQCILCSSCQMHSADCSGTGGFNWNHWSNCHPYLSPPQYPTCTVTHHLLRLLNAILWMWISFFLNKTSHRSLWQFSRFVDTKQFF